MILFFSPIFLYHNNILITNSLGHKTVQGKSDLVTALTVIQKSEILNIQIGQQISQEIERKLEPHACFVPLR